MADLMRWCIMHHDAQAHQVPRIATNNALMHEQTREIIRKLMSDHKITSDRRLALECNMDQSTLHRFMTKKTDTLNFNHIQAIAQYFEVTVSQLIGETPLHEDPKIRKVLLAMESLPEYKKDVIVATSQSLAHLESDPEPKNDRPDNKKAA